jgi:hypothetical protein
MSTTQRFIVMLGIILIGGSFLVPPWEYRQSIEYCMVIDNPRGSLAWGPLCAQVAGISTILGLSYALTLKKKEG